MNLQGLNPEPLGKRCYTTQEQTLQNVTDAFYTPVINSRVGGTSQSYKHIGVTLDSGFRFNIHAIATTYRIFVK